MSFGHSVSLKRLHSCLKSLSRHTSHLNAFSQTQPVGFDVVFYCFSKIRHTASFSLLCTVLTIIGTSGKFMIPAKTEPYLLCCTTKYKHCCLFLFIISVLEQWYRTGYRYQSTNSFLLSKTFRALCVRLPEAHCYVIKPRPKQSFGCFWSYCSTISSNYRLQLKTSDSFFVVSVSIPAKGWLILFVRLCFGMVVSL